MLRVYDDDDDDDDDEIRARAVLIKHRRDEFMVIHRDIGT